MGRRKENLYHHLLLHSRYYLLRHPTYRTSEAIYPRSSPRGGLYRSYGRRFSSSYILASCEQCRRLHEEDSLRRNAVFGLLRSEYRLPADLPPLANPVLPDGYRSHSCGILHQHHPLLCVYVVYSRSNAQRDRDPAGAESEDATQDLVDAFSDLTDRENKKLRYKL